MYLFPSSSFPNHYGERDPRFSPSSYSLRIHTSHQSTFQAIGKSCCLCLCLRADNCVGTNTERARQTIEFQFRSVEALLPVTRLNKQSFPLIRQWRRAALWRIYSASGSRARNDISSRRRRNTCANSTHNWDLFSISIRVPSPFLFLPNRRGSPARACSRLFSRDAKERTARSINHRKDARVASTMRAFRSVSLTRVAIYVTLHNARALSFRRDFGSKALAARPFVFSLRSRASSIL